MRKLMANYLVSNRGEFLKNGMAFIGEDGLIDQYIDTRGNLRELEQLTFHNGIVMAGFQFVKESENQPVIESVNLFHSLVHQEVGESNTWSLEQLVELGKLVQKQFPDQTIPSIIGEIEQILLKQGGFVKETILGIYLLTGVDLSALHFTPRTRLKKIS